MTACCYAEYRQKTFAMSINMCETSSEIFIRRFMHSNVAKLLDNNGWLNTTLWEKDISDLIDEEYGRSDPYERYQYSA